MKKIILTLITLFLLKSGNTYAEYNAELDNNPLFMEDVYSFINSEDITDNQSLSYCQEVYLEATRRREYTESETVLCGAYFTKKNNEEKAYMQYMFNNRELFK